MGAFEAGGHDLRFKAAYTLTEGAEAALEDYARVLARAEAAVALRAGEDPRRVGGVRLQAAPAAPSEELTRDLEDFARDLAERAPEGGPEWS